MYDFRLHRFFPTYDPLIRSRYMNIIDYCKSTGTTPHPPDILLNMLITDLIKHNNTSKLNVSEINEISFDPDDEVNGQLISEDDMFVLDTEQESVADSQEISAFQARKPFAGKKPYQNYNGTGSRPKQRFKVPISYKNKCLLCLRQVSYIILICSIIISKFYLLFLALHIYMQTALIML